MQICAGKKMAGKKGKKSVRDLFFKLHFAWKKRELCDVHGGGGRGSPPRCPAPCRRLTVSIFLVFVFFLFTISARQLYTPPLYHPAYLTRSGHPPPPTPPFTSHPFVPPLDEGLLLHSVRREQFKRRLWHDGWWWWGDSFLKVSFWFWRWQIHTVLSSVVCRRPRTHTHTNTVPLLIQSHRTLCIYIMYVCVCAERRFFISLSVYATQTSHHRWKGLAFYFFAGMSIFYTYRYRLCVC